MSATINLDEAIKAPFGTIFADKMAITHYRNGAWEPFSIQPFQNLSLSPATHVFHYASACFEGLKAHRRPDGVYIYRLDAHMKRLHHSAGLLCMPQPTPEMAGEMVSDLVRLCADWTPEPPGSLYIRPTLIGSMPSIGAAASPTLEATFYVILSPVGDYFKAGPKPLKLLLSEETRTAAHFGMAKTGGNYASALSRIMKARKEFGVDQVLFAPDDDVQETGAANFLLISDKKILTKNLDTSFLHGITRDSLLTLGAEMGYEVEERSFTTTELLEWIKNGEAALSGTAAVLSGVGKIVFRGEEHLVGNGEVGPNTLRLRQALLDLQQGRREDAHGWCQKV